MQWQCRWFHKNWNVSALGVEKNNKALKLANIRFVYSIHELPFPLLRYCGIDDFQIAASAA